MLSDSVPVPVHGLNPAAKGKRWNEEEDIRLLAEIKENISFVEVASNHSRTTGGISSRLRELACGMLKNGKSMEYVISVTHLSETQVNDALNRKECAQKRTEQRKIAPKPTKLDIASVGTTKIDSFITTANNSNTLTEKNTQCDCDAKVIVESVVETSGNEVTLVPDAAKTRCTSTSTSRNNPSASASASDTTPRYTLSVEQRCALQQFEDGDSLFITGEGGTGKTLLIRHLVESAKRHYRKIQVCAMTGCAALLLECNARTIHSWSGIKLAKGTVDETVEGVLYNHAARNSWRTTDVLVIDEVSMMSARIFDLLNIIGKRVRKSSRPFGGMQVVLVGDFFQLPPVSKQYELLDGDDKFCFESNNWFEIFPMDNHIVMNTIFRQKDEELRRILGNIRKGVVAGQDVKVLRSLVDKKYDKEKHGGVVPTKLLPTKSKVDDINNRMFRELAGEPVVYDFERRSDCTSYLDGSDKPIPGPVLAKCRKLLTPQRVIFEHENLANNTPCVKTLALKKGANVMCTVNLNMDKGICNGSIGTVVGFKHEIGGGESDKMGAPVPIVLFSNGYRMTMSKKFWQSEDFPTVAVGQYPLCLAWAITIHKIQGATLAMAEIDIGGSIFECGQTYVALSRVKSLDGLYLSSFEPKKIKVHQKVKDFYQSIPVVEYEDETDNDPIPEPCPKSNDVHIECPKNEIPKNKNNYSCGVESELVDEVFVPIPRPILKHSQPICPVVYGGMSFEQYARIDGKTTEELFRYYGMTPSMM